MFAIGQFELVNISIITVKINDFIDFLRILDFIRAFKGKAGEVAAFLNHLNQLNLIVFT